MDKIKVIIADDDHLVVEDLLSLINWKKLGFYVVSVASSGEETLQKIEEYQPDLLITDICMLGMNGLDAIEIAHQKWPHMKFLIISSYNDFQYVKRALNQNVLDYLLKPEISAPKLTQTLLTVKNAFFKDQEADSSWMVQEMNCFMDTPSMDLSSFPHLLKEARTEYYFTIWAPARLFYRHQQDAQPEHIRKLQTMQTTLLKMAKEYFALPVGCISSDIVIIGLPKETELSASVTTLSTVYSRFLYRLTDIIPMPIQMILQQRPMTLEQFRTRFRALLPLIHYHLFFSPDNHKIVPEMLENEYYLPVKGAFSFHSLIMEEDHFEEDVFALKKYIMECCSNFDIYSLLKFYQSFCTHLEICSNNTYQPEDTLSAPTPEHFQKWIFNNLFSCIQNLSHGTHFSYSPVVEQALQFMSQNLSNIGLTAVDIADSVCLSANRLGVIFKQETGKTVNESLSQLRVEKAIEYLEKTNMKIYEISEKCGYKSSQYFSQVILQKTGKRPIDFRKVKK